MEFYLFVLGVRRGYFVVEVLDFSLSLVSFWGFWEEKSKEVLIGLLFLVVIRVFVFVFSGCVFLIEAGGLGEYLGM